MIDNRPEADRILVAQLRGTAGHHARWRELSGDEEATAVAELRELADLLAKVAGILEGFAERMIEDPRGRSVADLCRKAEPTRRR
jgi:hypothetical protein